jgi:predicted permease
MAMQMPYSGNSASTIAAPPGYVPRPNESMDVEWRVVTPSFFETLGIRIVPGRAFTETENRGDAAHVVVITERLAQRFWPDEDPVGKTLEYWDRQATIVGVAANVRDSDLMADPNQAFYIPYAQASGDLGTIALRTSGDPAALAGAARRRIGEIDAGLAIVSAGPLTDWVAGTIAQQRFRARLMAAFAVLAALLAVMSVYGVISRSVARRMREMGIRAALGAPLGNVVRLVIAESLRLSSLGIACGLLASLALTQLLQSMLFGVRVTDPLTYASIAVLLGGLAVLAALAPARRALRADPVQALRAE